MIWAKAEKKRFFQRPRMAMMTIYTVGLCLLSLSAFAEESMGKHRVTLQEVEALIAEELMRTGAGKDVQASVIGRRSSEIVERDVPITMEMLDLQSDDATGRFKATISFATEAGLNRPAQKLGNLTMAGRYEEMVEVPVVKFRLTSADIIREEDIEWQKMPQRRTDRDTIMEAAEMIGKSPVRGLTPNRGVTHSELQNPPIVLRRAPVQMSYETKNISIKALGTAMQDGAMGDRIKVRNDDSGIILDARVVERGRVEVSPPVYMN